MRTVAVVSSPDLLFVVMSDVQTCQDDMVMHRGRKSQIVLFCALALMLTGCLRYRVDLSIDKQDTVSGTVVFGIKMSASSGTANRTQPSPPKIPDDLAGRVKVQPYDQDGYLGFQASMNKLTFAQVSQLFEKTTSTTQASQGSPSASDVPSHLSTITLRHDGDRIRLSGRAFIPLIAFGANPSKDLDGRIAMTFPGDVVSTNGKKDHRTVTWSLAMGQVTDLQAEAKDSGAAMSASADNESWIRWVIAAGGAALVLFIATALILARRKRQEPAPAFDAAQFQVFMNDQSTQTPGSGYPYSEPSPYAPPAPQAPTQGQQTLPDSPPQAGQNPPPDNPSPPAPPQNWPYR